MSDIIPFLASFCAAVSAFCAVLLIYDLLRAVEIEKNDASIEKKRVPVFFRIFFPLAPNLQPLFRTDAAKPILKKTADQILMAGYEDAMTPEQYLVVRIFFAIICILVSMLMFASNQTLSGALLLLIGLMYPVTWLQGLVRKRHLEIMKALPNVLDLLTLSVEAGKDFLSALRDIIQRREKDAISEELARALHEIQLGKSRQAALREMINRVKQPDFSSVISSIIQSDELGVSIAQVLQIQGDQIRMKRFARAEKKANETPVKIMFAVIIFIFPSVFIILIAPIVMQAMKSFF